MQTVVWVPLLVFGIAALGGLTMAVVEGLGAWRAFRRFRRSVGTGLLEAERRLADTERSLARAGKKTAELERARVHLQQALATASLLTGGAGEAWELVGRVRGIVPRK